eukprot:1287057-Prorocentrum_lima.AAC.1
MTSSLVGSEMCIRDSIPRRRGRPWWVGVVQCGEVLRTAAVFAIGAVSYTHLTLPTICSV